MKQNQIPMKKLTDDQRANLELELVEQIGKLEVRREKEKERRGDWNKATKKTEKDISQIARKLREDAAAPTPEESAEDRQTAEEIAERMVGDEETDSDSDE